MPTIQKVRGKKKKKAARKRIPKTGSVASRIIAVGDIPEKGVTLNLYGLSKTGKTRFACSFPKPLLLVATEDGTLSVRDQKGVDFFRLQNSEEFDEITDILATGRYASAALDTGGGLQDIIVKEVAGLSEIAIQKSWGMVSQKMWGPINAQTKNRFRSLLDFSESQGTNVIVIAHEREFSSDVDSDLIFPTVGAALTPGVSGWLDGACDYICQTLIRAVTKKSTTEIGGKKVEMETRTGKAEYCLRVGPHAVYRTGFRHVGLGTDLPDMIRDPSYKKLKALIDGS